MPENRAIPPEESLAGGWSAPPMPRKIVQFMESDDTLTVLCNDGTLWTLTEGGTKWIQPWPPIPQDAAHNLLARARLAERMAEALEGARGHLAEELVAVPHRHPTGDCPVLDHVSAVLREWYALNAGCEPESPDAYFRADYASARREARRGLVGEPESGEKGGNDGKNA